MTSQFGKHVFIINYLLSFMSLVNTKHTLTIKIKEELSINIEKTNDNVYKHDNVTNRP